MAILSDEQGIEALRCRQGSVTPMGMLIEYLPGIKANSVVFVIVIVPSTCRCCRMGS